LEERDRFLNRLSLNLPEQALISDFYIKESPFEDGLSSDFQIVPSQDRSKKSAFISPDFGVCTPCQNDLLEETNNRFLYPFISCTDCGPRYSILQGIPYDRGSSSMGDFEMCSNCCEEYLDPKDRRFHSQTSSCPECRITLTFSPDQNITSAHSIEFIEKAVALLEAGKILAVKATAGFLLLADATNSEALFLLRERKKRPKKPLAMMVPDSKALADFFDVSPQEIDEISSYTRPILLCKPKEDTSLQSSKELIAPGLSLLGVCLPADPLIFLITRVLGKPLITTSGNLHKAPIQFDNVEAIENLLGLADAVLYHTREIHFPQDDSVMRITPIFRHRIILRRSRGLAPSFWNSAKLRTETPVLALGADLKSTFALWDEYNVHVSQYIGNLESYDTQERFGRTLDKFMELIGIMPQHVLIDKHPQYHSRQLAGRFSTALVTEVPHHEAHFASLLWEHAALHSDEPILGVVWDGLGLGSDGALWGSEFFVYRSGELDRILSFDYFDYVLGDKMSKEPRIAAMALSYHAGESTEFLKEKFTDNEYTLYSKMLEKGNHVQTSSMGRVFDAMASILDISDFNSYEGEGAMLLEKIAQLFFDTHGYESVNCYELKEMKPNSLSFAPIIRQVLEDKRNGVEAGLISAKFHITLVKIVIAVLQRSGCSKVGFSGGVFQNALLVDLLHEQLGKDYQLLFHKQLSPNDENISLGQMAWFHIKYQFQPLKSKSYVLGDSR
jgi:hydrogenase maturation protein HypF